MCDLLRTALRCSLVGIIPPVLRTHLHLHVSLPEGQMRTAWEHSNTATLLLIFGKARQKSICVPLVLGGAKKSGDELRKHVSSLGRSVASSVIWKGRGSDVITAIGKQVEARDVPRPPAATSPTAERGVKTATDGAGVRVLHEPAIAIRRSRGAAEHDRDY